MYDTLEINKGSTIIIIEPVIMGRRLFNYTRHDSFLETKNSTLIDK